MKPTPEPTRLLDELEASADLHRGLSRLQANAPSAASLAAMAASLGIPAAAPVPVVVPKSGLPMLKLVGSMGLIVGAVVGGAQLWPEGAKRASVESAGVAAGTPSETSSPSAREGAAVGRRASGSPAAVIDATGPAAADSPAVDATDAEASRVAEVPTERSPVVGGQQRAASGAPRAEPASPRKLDPAPASAPRTSYAPLSGTAARQSEMDLLRDARSALGGSPAVALALTEKHRQDYARGAFSQERELIAITALARLGRSGDAQQRADRFRRDYPNSAYRRQIDQLVPQN